MNLKKRISDLEKKDPPETSSYRRVICEENETPDQACKRLGIVDKERIIFRIMV